MQLRKARISAVLAAMVLSVLAVCASAQPAMDESMLDRWLSTTKAFVPMQNVFKKMSQSEAAQSYSPEEFATMSVEKQDELMDEILKDNDAYDKVYKVLEQNGWDSAGKYMRASERFGLAISAHMRQRMMEQLPPEQAKMVEQQMGEQPDVSDADVAFVKQNWERISTFMNENMPQQDMPASQ